MSTRIIRMPFKGERPAHSMLFRRLSLIALGCAALSVAAQMPSPKRAGPHPDPDADAYRALAAGNQAELVRARGEGGDAARYARENPEAIYDAMRSERDIDVLEFVLKSGANPNAQRSPALKGTPIFANLMDRDKVALLLRYGADPNARDYSGYAPLSHLLFSPFSEYKVPASPRPGQVVRVFSKIEIVRLLLDGGAAINGNLGGWGNEGALGTARREDKDVIALLIARGATLRDAGPGPLAVDKTQTNRGPLTVAIQRDRDDLALALLARDKRIAANDNLALLEAARRGFSDVALALLSAGADPNAADPQGDTALGWAVRRKDAALAAALRKAGASPPAKPFKPAFEARNLDPFDLAVANRIDEVALFDPHRFYLSSAVPKSEVVFAFYGKEMNRFEAITCEQAVGFSIVTQANDQGSIQVGVCTLEAKRVLDAAHRAKAGVSQLVNPLAQSGPKIEQLKALGLEWRSVNLEGGWEGYSFPVLAVGHGILSVHTVVLSNRVHSVAVIVQADVQKLCEPTSGIRTRIRTPLCDETPKALQDIALAVARKS